MAEEGPLYLSRLCFLRSKQERTNPRFSRLSGVDTHECPDILALSPPVRASILHCPKDIIPLPTGSAEISPAVAAAHQRLSPSLSSTGSLSYIPEKGGWPHGIPIPEIKLQMLPFWTKKVA